jgi:hypothetical protein
MNSWQLKFCSQPLESSSGLDLSPPVRVASYKRMRAGTSANDAEHNEKVGAEFSVKQNVTQGRQLAMLVMLCYRHAYRHS